MSKATESTIQKFIMRHVRQLPYFGKRFTVFAIPNGGLRAKSVATAMKAEGVQKGVPDLCILCSEGRVFWVEMKKKGNYLSPEQKAFHAFLNGTGHEVVTITAIDPIDGWLQFSEQLKRWGIM